MRSVPVSLHGKNENSTVGVTTLSIMTLGITTWSIMTFNIMTLGITTWSIMTFSIMSLFETLVINDTQRNNTGFMLSVVFNLLL